MSAGVDHLARELVRLLKTAGQPADQFTAGPGSAGVNVWGEDVRYPLMSITISDTGKFHDYAWGHSYEHTMPIDTPPATVCAEVLRTLGEESSGQ